MAVSSPENDPGLSGFFVRRSAVHVTEPGVFDTARMAFEWLVTGPDPVALDCRPIPGLPARPVPLDELGTLLLDQDRAQPTRDAAWAALVTRSRADGAKWTVACVGLALPWLVRVAASLAALTRDDVHDVHAAVLTGFLEALATVDLDRPMIVVRLRWSAFRSGYAAVREALHAAAPVGDPCDEDVQGVLAALTVPRSGFRSCPPPQPSGHPELALLLAAADAGVISAGEATLIGATRFGDLSLAEAAQARGQTYEAARKTRRRAESRLAAHLTPETAAGFRRGTPGAEIPRCASATPTASQLRSVTRRSPGPAQNLRRPASVDTPESGVDDRGPCTPDLPGPHRLAAVPGSARGAA
ncbi:hypothetical protein SAMN04489727_1979 [Amycolatopsis tolypomycina]|uniref:DNA-directed RNA polymerase specialized sigma subunit, sigma24 family n=1 Tax=Amycolatopsis tolypomycina TaxID=208445 RepID=A0A1H4JM15_9PSEU|nr:hypothetical protein [Amycolatopsis tolypomycina]SEB46682.1 hypothetical protein SAMN04489727_1979 [Amycolatopsis tolypomycina]